MLDLNKKAEMSRESCFQMLPLVILWESEGRDSLHLAHCTSLLKAGICCRNREVVLVCEHGAGGSFCYCAAA